MWRCIFVLSCFLLMNYANCAHVAKQKVTLIVAPISKLAISGDPSPLTVVSPSALHPVQSVIDNSTSMNCTTNRDCQRIVAQIDEDLPPFCSIYCKLGLDGEFYPLSSEPTILKFNVHRGVERGVPVFFKFEVSQGVQKTAQLKRQVRFTLLST